MSGGDTTPMCSEHRCMPDLKLGGTSSRGMRRFFVLCYDPMRARAARPMWRRSSHQPAPQPDVMLSPRNTTSPPVNAPARIADSSWLWLADPKAAIYEATASSAGTAFTPGSPHGPSGPCLPRGPGMTLSIRSTICSLMTPPSNRPDGWRWFSSPGG